jgi:lysyl-tRNA synthetase, class II
MATMKDFRDERLRKLSELTLLGIDSYPADSERTHNNQQITDEFGQLEGKTVIVVGRIVSIRKFGKLAFVVIRDGYGQVQLFWRSGKESADRSQSELLITDVHLLDTGDFVQCSGEVIRTQTGEVSVNVLTLRLLSKALRPMPTSFQGFSDVETRYRQRYIDLHLNPEVKKDIEVRSKVTEIIRQFLIRRQFIELETPVLQPLYGGASARPFETYHNKLESDLYLRISNELYLKRAIVGGFERVFEFSRDFRNEGIDRSHNPEFTMLEFYWAYANYDDLMTMTEEMLSEILQQLFGSTKFSYQGHELDFTPPYRRVTFREIILENTGLDIDNLSTDDLWAEIKKRKIDVEITAPRKDLLDEFYKETCRKGVIQPIYLTDYPAEMIPLAKKKADNPTYISSVQLVCCGFELLKAYNELNDPIDQLARLTEDQKGLDEGTTEEGMNVDIDFVRALEVGMPPTAGWGMGIDRLVSFLCDKPAIKDVILFPTLRPEDFTEEVKDFYPQVQLPKKKAIGKKQKRETSGAELVDGIRFSIDVSVKADFPEAAIGYLVAELPASSQYDSSAILGQATDSLVARNIEQGKLSEVPEIAAWRKAYSNFGVKPSEYLCSAEALAKRAAKSGLTQISTFVDIYNAVSVKNLIPMGAVDLDHVNGDIVVRYGKVGETVDLLGMSEVQTINDKQVVYADNDKVITWLWNHRDAKSTAITEGSERVVFFADSLMGDVPACQAISDLAEELVSAGATIIGSGLVK